MNKLFINFLIFASFLISIRANAQVGDFQFINTMTVSEGSAFGSKNTKQNLYSFIEYGYSKKTSFGGILNASRTDSVYNGGTTQYAIIGPELFHRYKFFAKGKNGIVLHNSVKLPGNYDENRNLGLMPKQWDYEVRLMFLHNFHERLVSSIVHNSTPYFVRTELAYRQRFNNPFNEVRFAFWGNFDIGEKYAILIQDNTTWNIANDGYTSNSLNNTYQNFDITKDANNLVTTSIIYHYNKHMAFQVGYVKRISGNNPFYDRQGVVVGIWNALR